MEIIDDIDAGSALESRSQKASSGFIPENWNFSQLISFGAQTVTHLTNCLVVNVIIRLVSVEVLTIEYRYIDGQWRVKTLIFNEEVVRWMDR